MTATNWAGNYQYTAARMHRPGSVDELVEIVRSSAAVRILGSRHSFNDIADTEGDLVSLADLPQDIRIDASARTVSLAGGVTYGQLAPVLTAAGWGLGNLASLPHISVAGAVATGTHGSGRTNPGLGSSVAALDIVTGSGEVVSVTRDSPDFDGAVVNLGALGAVVHLTLDIEPSYDIRQTVFEHLPFDELTAHFDEISDSAYSVSVFTDWTGPSARQVWVKSRSVEPSTVFGATPAMRPMHPLADQPGESCTAQFGEPGAWSDRLPHFRLEFTPSNGAEVQSEFLIGREHAASAIEVLRSLGPRMESVLLVSEIRSVAASELWLDPAFRRDSVAFHFTWCPDQPAVEGVLPLIEAGLAEFAPRPHWGKLFTMPAQEIGNRYQKLPDFRALREQWDPRGVFFNSYLERTIGR